MSLITVIAELKADMELSTLSEAEISQIIRCVFTMLGWDADNRREVKPEHAVANGWVDYALVSHDVPQVFVEVKKGGEPLERHQEQLLEYAGKDIGLSVLTNGLDWWFYWEQRRFATASIDKDAPAEIAELLSSVIGKENVDTGKAFETALSLAELPKAWEALLAEPGELLVELVAHKTQELCGEVPDAGAIRAFLRALPDAHALQPPNAAGRKRGNGGKPDLTLVFNGKRYPVDYWKMCLVRLCEVLALIHKDRFADVLTVPSLNCPFGQRPYFSRRESELQEPLPIGDTGIYVHTFVGSHQVKRLVGLIASHFGHDPPVIEESRPP